MSFEEMGALLNWERRRAGIPVTKEPSRTYTKAKVQDIGSKLEKIVNG